jgi:hypothetical protein
MDKEYGSDNVSACLDLMVKSGDRHHDQSQLAAFFFMMMLTTMPATVMPASIIAPEREKTAGQHHGYHEKHY